MVAVIDMDKNEITIELNNETVKIKVIELWKLLKNLEKTLEL